MVDFIHHNYERGQTTGTANVKNKPVSDKKYPYKTGRLGSLLNKVRQSGLYGIELLYPAALSFCKLFLKSWVVGDSVTCKVGISISVFQFPEQRCSLKLQHSVKEKSWQKRKGRVFQDEKQKAKICCDIVGRNRHSANIGRNTSLFPNL